MTLYEWQCYMLRLSHQQQSIQRFVEIQLLKKVILYEEWQTRLFSFVSWIPEEVLQAIIRILLTAAIQ